MPTKGAQRFIKEVEKKGNNYGYNNTLKLKLKIKNNRNGLIYTKHNFFLKGHDSGQQPNQPLNHV
jgi:hypothetical protein